MRRALLLDACVVINLQAAGLWSEVADAVAMDLVVVEQVARESLRILDEEGDSRAIDLHELQRSGGTEIWSLIDDELVQFVAFARRLGDGEAATLAAAVSRDLPLATDDRVARRVATSLPSPPQLLDTCDLLYAWATTSDAGRDRVAAVLQRVRERARFVAPTDSPHHAWWQANLAQDAA